MFLSAQINFCKASGKTIMNDINSENEKAVSGSPVMLMKAIDKHVFILPFIHQMFGGEECIEYFWHQSLCWVLRIQL